jgi:hypothetical protein
VAREQTGGRRRGQLISPLRKAMPRRQTALATGTSELFTRAGNPFCAGDVIELERSSGRRDAADAIHPTRARRSALAPVACPKN